MEQQVPELERAKRLIRAMAERTTDRGCTEHEAMEAAEKVGALLKQFDLQLSDVFIAAEICKQVEVFCDDDTIYPVVGGIARLCSLRHYHLVGATPPTYILFGFERDIELALYLYEVLMEAMSTEWSAYTKDHGFARKKRDSFRLGFCSRVRDRLYRMRAERDREAAERAVRSDSRDLVLVRDAKVDEEFAKTGVRLVSGPGRKIHSGHAYGQGLEAGARAQINVPLNGDARSMLD